MAQGLTLEQLQQMGAQPVQQTGGQTLEQLQSQQQPPLQTFLQPLQNFGNQVNERADKTNAILNDKTAAGKTNILEKGAAVFGQGLGAANDLVGDVIQGGLNGVNQLTGGAAGRAAQSGLQAVSQTPLGAMGIQAIKGGMDKWQEFQDKYPRAAQDLSAVPEVANMLLNFVGGGAGATAAKTGGSLIREGLKVGAEKAVEVGTARTAAAGEKALARTVDAVTPELKGKNLTQAYKDVVSGKREVEPGGLIKPQGISASERESGVGKRLFDAGVKLENKPVKDIVTLRGALKNTEGELEDVLKGDPEMVYNADKQTLFSTLNTIGKNMPEEFKAIKDNGAVFNSVLNFGKKVLTKAEDNVVGLRNARTAFDAQAKLEFPSAFKSGTIDTKTPAGRAIKAVRDAINDHLYDTAPEGSKIKELIGREADIFRATDAIAPRAAAGQGTSAAQRTYQTIKKHPLITAGAAYEGIKHTVAPGLPGL